MAQIYSSDLTKELRDGAKIQIAIDKIPNELAEKVVPVMEVNPRLVKIARIVKGSVASNAVSTTIYTTPSDQDFYLTSATLCWTKDATATTTEISLKAYIDGSNPRILSVGTITLTAQTGEIGNNFPHPIKIDRGTAITIAASTAIGNFTAAGCIQGYLEDSSNA